MVKMVEKPSEVQILRRLDIDTALKLRTRLLAFRLRVLAGKVDLTNLIAEAWNLAEKTIAVDSDEIVLNDRRIDVGASLLVSGCYFNDPDSVLSVMARSQKTTKDSLRESFTGDVFGALQTLYGGMQTLDDESELLPISTRGVGDELNRMLSVEGNDGKDQVKTRTVTNALRIMGFEFERRSSNLSFFKRKNFKAIFEMNQNKFGKSSNEKTC
jgi:hypothetical protein